MLIKNLVTTQNNLNIKPLRFSKGLNSYENNFVLLGFSTLLIHLSRVRIHDNSRHGLTIVQFLKKKTNKRSTHFGSLSINPLLIFHQWRSLCFILQYLASKQVFIVPVVHLSLKHLATAFSWGTSTQPLSVLRLVLNKINNNTITTQLQNLSQHACVLLLNQTERNALKNLTLVPSIGVLKPFEEFTPWAGITTLRDDVLLQYFLLSWAWRFLK